MFLIMSVQIDSSHGIEGDWRSDFLFKEVFIRVFAEPWVC